MMLSSQNRRLRDLAAKTIDWFAAAAEVDPETGRRRRILVLGGLIAAVSFCGFAALSVARFGLDAIALTMLVGAVIALAGLTTIRWSGRYEPALFAVAGLGVVTLTALAYQTGGLTAPAITAFITCPLLATVVGRFKSGAACGVLVSGAAVFLWAFAPPRPELDASFVELNRLGALLGTVGGTLWAARYFEAERQRSAAILARSQADFQRLVDSSRDAVVVIRHGRIAYANAAMATLFGFDTAAPLVGRALVEAVHPEDRDAVAPHVAKVLDAHDRTETVEVSFRRPDGVRVTIALDQVERVDFGGEEGLLVAGRDIREKKRLEAQLRMADRMASVGSLAAGVAHEVNNPLTYVMTNLSFAVDAARAVRGGGAVDELDDAIEALVEAQDGADRVQRIVRDLQSFSRDSAPECARVDMRAVLASAVKMAGHEVKHRASIVEDHEAKALPSVWGDEPKLAQIFLNLVVNAAQAIPTGARQDHQITIRTRSVGTPAAPWVVVEVEDTGCGIDDAVLDRIFDPFFTTKGVGEGTGLGLAIAHELVTSMKGRLSLRNNEHRGATARVELPGLQERTSNVYPSQLPPKSARDDVPEVDVRPRAAAAKPTGPAAVASTALPTPPRYDALISTEPGPRERRILIVDDEPLVAEALRRMLRDAYEVEVVHRGMEALERLTRCDYQAVFCDITMPEMSGMELYDEVARMLSPEQERFIFMTGGAFTAEAKAFLARLRRGNDPPCIEKPFAREEVLDALARVGNVEDAHDVVGLPPVRYRNFGT
ncbi:MAG: ATP-binding protein [Myxococcota bacterium]